MTVIQVEKPTHSHYMQQAFPVHKILFLDVETVPQEVGLDQMPESWQQLWKKKASVLRGADQTTPEDAYGKAGIYAEFGKIICISAGYFIPKKAEFRITSYYGTEEQMLLSAFADLLNEQFPARFAALCAHNGREFDFPYLGRRMLANGVGLPKMLRVQGKKPWEIKHFIDTMQLWSFGDYKHFTSLELLAAVFNIPSPKSDMDGSDVASVFYQDQDLERIVRYCEADVLTLAKVYLALTGKDITDFDEKVEIVKKQA